MTTYKQPEKDKSRILLWNHAVESLTSLRDSNRILNTTYMEHLWLYCQQQLNEKLEAVLISFDKSVKHDLDECNLYHSFCGFSKEFVIDGQPSEVFQP